MRALAEVAPDFADRFPLSSALAGAGGPVSEDSPAASTPILERAARRVFRRAVELLLAGASAG